VEEAAQEVFLKVYTELESYEGRGSFEGWITRITTNVCLNLLRAGKRRPETTVSDLTEDQSEWLESMQSRTAMEQHLMSERGIMAADLADRILNTLEADDRLVITLVDGEGLSIKEVAEITGWSESKVKVQSFRARNRFREGVERLLAKGREKR
jgi:RNA polymerase sigma factor (sigma-70 family)